MHIKIVDGKWLFFAKMWIQFLILDQTLASEQRCRIFFSLEKVLSHLLTPFRDLRYFFSGSGKKYSPENSDYLGLGRWTPSKIAKMIFWVNVSKKSNSRRVIRFFCQQNGDWGNIMRILVSKKVWSGKKIPLISLTHSFF